MHCYHDTPLDKAFAKRSLAAAEVLLWLMALMPLMTVDYYAGLAIFFAITLNEATICRWSLQLE